VTNEIIEPIGDYILVRPFDSAKETKGGIQLPDSHKDPQLRAEVISVGPGRMNEFGSESKPTVKKGDIVLIGGRQSGDLIEINGVKHILLKEDSIVALVKKESPVSLP